MGAFQAGLILLRMEDYPKANELSGVDRLVLMTLFSFAADDDRPQAFASAPRIAVRSGVARRTVQRSLDHLEEVGVISGEHRHRKPTRWSLDAYFTKTGGVTQSPTSVRETPDKRQSDAQQASERRSAGVRETLQCTEVGSGAKRRNRTDVRKGGSRSGEPARSARRAPSARPPTDGDQSTRTTGSTKPTRKSGSVSAPPKVERPPCPHGIIGGLDVIVPGDMKRRFRCENCYAVAPDPNYRYVAWQRWIAQHPTLDIEVHCTDPHPRHDGSGGGTGRPRRAQLRKRA